MVRRVQSRPPTTIELPPMKKQCPSPPPRPTLKIPNLASVPERPIIHSGNREEMYRKVVCRCGKAPCQSPCGKCPPNDWILRTTYDAMREVSPVSPGSVSSGSEYDVSPLSDMSDSQDSPDSNAPTSPTIPPSVSPVYRADSPIYYRW